MNHFFSEQTSSQRRPSFLFSTTFLIGIMFLYSLAGFLLLFVLTGTVFAGFEPAWRDDSLTGPIRLVQVLSQVLVLALPVVVLAGLHAGGEFLGFLGIRRNVSWEQVGYALSGLCCLLPLLSSIAELQNLFLWPSLGSFGREVLESRQLMEELTGKLASIGSVPEVFVVPVVLALTPACCEELFFRGYLQQNYYRVLGPAGSVLFTGCIFAVFHLSVADFVPLALLGWYIGYIFMKSGNLAVPFAVHLFNNLLALVFLQAVSFWELSGVRLVFSPWWWIIVIVTLFLFVSVMRRFRAACS